MGHFFGNRVETSTHDVCVLSQLFWVHRGAVAEYPSEKRRSRPLSEHRETWCEKDCINKEATDCESALILNWRQTIMREVFL